MGKKIKNILVASLISLGFLAPSFALAKDMDVESNGHSFNGHSFNGHSFNGHSFNGHSFNGLASHDSSFNNFHLLAKNAI